MKDCLRYVPCLRACGLNVLVDRNCCMWFVLQDASLFLDDDGDLPDDDDEEDEDEDDDEEDEDS